MHLPQILSCLLSNELDQWINYSRDCYNSWRIDDFFETATVENKIVGFHLVKKVAYHNETATFSFKWKSISALYKF